MERCYCSVLSDSSNSRFYLVCVSFTNDGSTSTGLEQDDSSGGIVMAYFPMFVDLTNQNCLVVGGGNVALRKIKLLLDFDARVEVVTLSSCEELVELARTNHSVRLMHRAFLDSDVNDKNLVIASTNDSICNHKISTLCQQQRIPVNVVDTKEECSFIVPSYVKEKDVVAAFSSAGKCPVLTQYLKKKEYEYLKPLIGDINEYTGE